jgi:hypothetical protein
MASALSLFSLIVGIALVLAGIGFVVPALAAVAGRPVPVPAASPTRG